MAEGERTHDDAADAGAAGGRVEDGGAGRPASGAEAAGNDPAGFEPSNVGEPRRQGGEGGGGGARPGDWNPGERSGGGGGELY
jgi:hypothetical protein